MRLLPDTLVISVIERPHAQGLEIDAQDRLAALQARGLQDVGGRGGRGALDMDRADLEPHQRQLVAEAVQQDGADAVHPRLGREGGDQHQGEHAAADRQGGTGPQADALGGLELGRRVGARARSGPRARGADLGRGGLRPRSRVETRSPPHYRGHEASSVIHRTRSSNPRPFRAACSGASEVGVMPG